MKTRLLALMCTIALVVTMIPFNIAYAASTQEKGSKIEVNKGYEGVLDTETEVDWYTVDVVNSGYFQVTFDYDDADENLVNYGWDLVIYDSDEKIIKEVKEITNKYISPKLPFATGTYYVKVKANWQYEGGAPTGCTYDINVSNVASEVWECEYNESRSTANIINTGTAYYGNLYCEDDVDWYKVITDQKGYFQLNFDYDDIDEDFVYDGWDVIVYDSEGTEIKAFTGITSKYTSVKIPFAVGTYYVKVKANWQYEGGAPIDCIYNLKVDNVADEYWETEPNASMSTASVIKTGTTYYGNVYYAEDSDWYKVPIGKKGYFQIHFDYDADYQEAVNEGWDISVYDANGNIIKEFKEIKNKYTSVKLPFAAGIYYVNVKANWQYEYGAPIDCTYNLKVSNTASTIWESENNKTRATADKVVLNTKSYYCGNLYKAEDVDYFYFNVQNKGKIKLLFKANDVSTLPNEGYGWDVTIYNTNNGKQYQLDNVIGLKTKSVVLPQGKYYVKVTADWQYEGAAPIDCTYNLKVNYVKSPAKTSITKLTTAKRTVTVKWNKKSDATGYVIYRSTSKNGTYKQVAKITKKNITSYKFKNLKKGKRYYFKVKTYRTYNGVTAYSDMSKYKSIKVK